jgi:hypothetical protein
MEKVLATSDAGKVTVSQFIEFIKSNRDYGYLMPTEENIKSAIQETGTNDIIVKIAEDDNIESEAGYVKMLSEFENGLIVYKIDQEELNPSVIISDEEIKEYYDNNIASFTTTGDDKVTVKTLEEAKTEISNILSSKKFKESENEYINELKKKYEVTINEDVLENSMKDLKTESEEEPE